MKKLAIITARGGSKRIPRKNIKEFLGHPIIKYSVEAALKADCFDEVMVSTDDEEIANIAISLGAKVPFIRSERNSNDYATTADVISEVIDRYEEKNIFFDYVCCIYPTAPFITSKKLEKAYSLLIEEDANSVVPIVKFGFPILRSLKIENKKIEMNWPEYMNTRSQDLEPAYHDSGQFYFLKVNSFKENKTLFSNNSVGLEVPESEVQDIDTPEDWKIAEIKYTFLLNKEL